MVLPSVVNPTELLGRYLPEDSYFSISKNSVKPKAFMPPRNLRLSVFRIDGLNIDDMWDIGQKKVINSMSQPNKKLWGIADIHAYKVQAQDLAVEPDDKPPRHASITGWPEEKARQHSIAQELAAQANLRLKD